MKFIHLSDLHLGKRVNEYSMLEDQAYILKEILGIIDAEHPDGILIAGDLYDKSIPSAEAVELCDNFLVRLTERGLPVFVISGNHDSPERLAFCSRLIAEAGVHISPVYDGHIAPILMEDAFGPVHVYLLPFIKPASLRRFFPEEDIPDYTTAVSLALREMTPDPNVRNVLLAHQFVTGALHGGSEELYVGGSENVSADVFSAFDYVALGHIHRPQNVGSERIRYCGTPLKYDFSEAKHNKSVTVVELHEKDTLEVRTVPLIPKRDLVELHGTYHQLVSKPFYEGTSWQEDYVHVTLTDEADIPDAIGKLRSVYRNLMRLDYDNQRTRNSRSLEITEAVSQKTPLELFGDFYETQNGQPMSSFQQGYMESLIERIWEGEA